MTFSYLRAIANTKSNSIFRSYIISGSIYSALVACLVVPNLATLQLFLVCLQLFYSLLLFITGTISESMLVRSLELKKYSALIDFVQIYNFRDKYRTIADIYTFIGVGLVVANMLALGWIWQPIAFIFFISVGSIATYNSIANLPKIVAKFDLQEEDFE